MGSNGLKNKGLRLEEKFILVIAIVGIICFGLLGFISYRQVSQIIILQNKDDAEGMAATAANAINGDDFIKIASVEDKEYREVYDTLSNYKTNNLITYIYAMKKDGDHLVFVVDTDTEAPADFLEPYELLDDMIPAFSGNVCCDSEVTSDKWGDYFSAYAPIKTSEGEVVGIVGVDVGMDSINAILSQLRNLIIVLVTIFAAVSILIYIFISSNLMNKDLLTEISNYEKLMKVGNRRARMKKLDNYTGVLIDIKDFNYLNQKLGSTGGDQILRIYAQILKKKVRRSDFIASTGGDNFFALIKNNRIQDFLKEIEKIPVTFMIKNEASTFQIVARCGIYDIPEKCNMSEVMNCCTLALNTAKLQYDTDMVWFEKNMYEKMVQEQEVLNAFRVGIVRHEFVVYYQPKVNIYTNKLCGAEALVRWFRNGKMVPPDQFIPVLEKNNLVTELDFYVFEQVCKDIKAWLDKEIEVVKISSNFSKLHLRNEHFAEDIIRIKEKYEIDSFYIDAELTESSGFYNLDALTGFVNKMNDAGISVSIDDFGTGYSSLSLLKDLNVDVIKMDKSFFREMEAGQLVQEKMVANVIRMVQDLDRVVISEGIETEKQVEFLKSVDSPIVQGYLFDKPLPHSEFEKRLKEPDYSDKIKVLSEQGKIMKSEKVGTDKEVDNKEVNNKEVNKKEN